MRQQWLEIHSLQICLVRCEFECRLYGIAMKEDQLNIPIVYDFKEVEQYFLGNQ